MENAAVKGGDEGVNEFRIVEKGGGHRQSAAQLVELNALQQRSWRQRPDCGRVAAVCKRARHEERRRAAADAHAAR